jgi:hypothetical protein
VRYYRLDSSGAAGMCFLMALIFGAVGVWSILTGVHKKQVIADLASRGERAQAIVDSHEDYGGKDPSLTVRFYAGPRIVTKTLSVSPLSYFGIADGSIVPVVYLQEDPTKAQIVGNELPARQAPNGFIVGGAVVGTLALLLGIGAVYWWGRAPLSEDMDS